MGKAFGDFNGSLTFLAASVQCAPRLAERERIANGGRTRRSRFAQRPRERAPLEAQPIPAIHRVDVFIRRCGLYQSQAWLHAVEQFVDEELPAAARCAAGDKIPVEPHPRRPAPLDGRVDESEHTWPRSVRRRLARGKRVRFQVGDHHRAAE
jgi:hypothetical protein